MPNRTQAPPAPAQKLRLLGEIKLTAEQMRAVEQTLQRLIVRAYQQGCSLRELATAAGFGSHHRVQELLGKAARRRSTSA